MIMEKSKAVRIFIIAIRISLGLLFMYGGVKKFIPKPPRVPSAVESKVPDHVVKIRAFIGGMKQTGYSWTFLGVSEITCGLLLLSQGLALLGAVMLIPVVLNIFFFHLFLEPYDTGELFLTGLYLLATIFLLVYDYPKLKMAFLNFN